MIGELSILVLLAGIIWARYIMLQARKKLSNEEKAKLLEIFNPQAKIAYSLGAAMVVIFFMTASSHVTFLIGTIAFLLLIIAMIFKNITTYKQLKKLFPPAYLADYRDACVISSGAIITFFILQLLSE